jgi:putative ABC transport system permease protein
MMRTMRQIRAVLQINMNSLRQRLWLAVSGSAAIALVVFVLLGSLALSNGFEQSMRNAGAADVAMVLREGADAEINSSLDRDVQVGLAGAPGVAYAGGDALVSPEMYAVIDAIKNSGVKANLALRGVTPVAWKLRSGIRMVAGRMAQPGTNEIVVGESVAREFRGFAVGSKLQLHGAPWMVVGVFSTGGSVFESELWADLHVIQQLLGQGDAVQSVRVRLAGPGALTQLQAYVKGNPTFHLGVRSERAFYADESRASSDLITFLGKPLALIMALGALAGALNTMYGAIAERTREMATLRVIGYGRLPALAGTLIESLLLAAAGALVGMLLAYVVFNRMSSSMLGPNFSTVVFRLALNPEQLMQGARWALMIGLLGGLFPAISAVRRPLAASLAE